MRVGEAGEGEAALRRGVDGVEEGSHPLLGPRRGAPGPVNASVREPLRVWASPVTAASVHPPALPSAGHLQACPGPFSREQGSACAPFPPTDCQAPCWAPVG